MKRFARLLCCGFLLSSGPVFAGEDVTAATQISSLSDVAAGDFAPESMPVLSYIMQINDAHFDLLMGVEFQGRIENYAFNNRPEELADLKKFFEKAKGAPEPDIRKLIVKSGDFECQIKDVIILVTLRCLVGEVVVTASGGMPMGADDSAKQASYDKQAAYIALAPLEKIASMKPSK